MLADNNTSIKREKYIMRSFVQHNKLLARNEVKNEGGVALKAAAKCFQTMNELLYLTFIHYKN